VSECGLGGGETLLIPSSLYHLPLPADMGTLPFIADLRGRGRVVGSLDGGGVVPFSGSLGNGGGGECWKDRRALSVRRSLKLHCVNIPTVACPTGRVYQPFDASRLEPLLEPPGLLVFPVIPPAHATPHTHWTDHTLVRTPLERCIVHRIRVLLGRRPPLHIPIHYDKPSDLLSRSNLISQVRQRGPGLIRDALASHIVDIQAQPHLVDLVADVGIRLVLGRHVFGVVLLDEAEGGEVRHGLRIQRVEVCEDGVDGWGRHEPFCRSIVEILQDDMDAYEGARPAEAVDEPRRHRG
jgi:hypothetical protein